MQQPSMRVGLNWMDRAARDRAWYLDSEGANDGLGVVKRRGGGGLRRSCTCLSHLRSIRDSSYHPQQWLSAATTDISTET